MSQLNSKTNTVFTHEGAVATQCNPYQQLKRSIMCCMLWESNFYENGESISDRIAKLIPLVKPIDLVSLVFEAKEKNKLRHIPLFLIREMVRYPQHKIFVTKLLEQIIQRPDELCEFLSMYWKDGRCPIANSVKKGLAKAFTKFDEYQFAKYNRDNAIKLKDVLFLCHAKPTDEKQEALWKRLINNELKTPETWEVLLSTGNDKKETFSKLILKNKIGALAMLRNLRNMVESQVPKEIIQQGIANIKTDKVLPFRFINAAKHAPQFEPELEAKMFSAINLSNKLMNHTTILVDVSGSMDAQISNKSEITRMDAACGLAMLLREICKDGEILTFSELSIVIPPRRGFALRDSIVNSQCHSGTYLGSALRQINGIPHERLIVITDEQSSDSIPTMNYKHCYLINISTDKNGITYRDNWIHIDGWSESIIDFILNFEANNER